MNLNENIESINTDVVSKSHLGGIEMRLNDMDNYIYLCWMQMWAMTFWYCDEKEKRYRFQELLKVLNKTSSHEMEIFNLLFETLSIYGEDYMVLKLYDILLTLHLNPSFKVHNIVMKLLDKKKMEGNIKENLQNAFKDELKNIYNNKGFRNRTFKSKYYGNILSEDIMFFAFDSCINCQKDIDLEYASMNYKEMDRELTWTKCPSCGNQILPKITVQFGKEINKTGKMKQNTCKLDSVVLFSPFFLKDNYNSVALRACGVKLDVEDLMLKYSNIFWNSLWYFKLKKLEYDFMLPYEEDIETKVDEYLDICIGDEENEIKKYNKERYIRNFEVEAFKPDKIDIL
jgi:DNA-directed RNA polymerase subunit RPC12/RpoP